METNKHVLRCKTSTDANKLAGSIYSAHAKEQDKDIIIRVIGAGSLNQAIKALIISNRYFIRKGLVADVHPMFLDIDGEVTAIELRVVLRTA